MKQSPLEIKIENEQLIISIGIETLAAEFVKAILYELAEEDD